MQNFYIGINANNAICNDSFFDGSITLYPNSEKGNIYYTKEKVEKTKEFLNTEYKNFVISTINELNKKYNNDICFMIINNEVLKMCKEIDANFITNLENPVTSKLNDKQYTRELLNGRIPMLEYEWFNEVDSVLNKISSSENRFVLQKNSGTGGDGTYLVNKKLLETGLQFDRNSSYCISEYTKNLPLNITIIIGENDCIYLPISVQLIQIQNNKFRYIGGDFAYIENISPRILERIKEYSQIIVEELRKQKYLGIVGIDYILLENNQIKFMEINPRFQSSSFLLSMELEKKDNTNIAKLHYEALCKKEFDKVTLTSINKSFVNCNSSNNYSLLKNDAMIVLNGYYDLNETAIYRRVFERSILNEENFEKIKK